MMAIKFKNDSKRLEQEYEDLQQKNPYLLDLINDLSKYVEDTLSKDIVITMIFRTQEEQDDIYKDSPKYKVRKFKSPHQFFHGVDLRSRTFSNEEIEIIENYLNAEYNSTNYYKFTAKNHDVGLGGHFHVQYYKVK